MFAYTLTTGNKTILGRNRTLNDNKELIERFSDENNVISNTTIQETNSDWTQD